MNTQSKPQKRWMTSVLKTAGNELPALPFQRSGFSKRVTAAMPRRRMLHSA